MSETHEGISLRVIESLAAAADADPVELTPPLYHAIDPTALDRLFEGNGPVTVTFEYDGYEVKIDADGTVSVDGVVYD